MQEQTEHWKDLCAQAAVEQHPQKLLELANELLYCFAVRRGYGVSS